MKTAEDKNNLIADAYTRMHDTLVGYITRRIGDHDMAEDFCQDVFLRTMECETLNKESISSLVFTIARNIVTDYLRRKHLHDDIANYLYHQYAQASVSTLQEVITHDLEEVERARMATLPNMRGKVYALSRYGEKTTTEIAIELGISKRTADAHLFAARKDIRRYMKACI